MVGRRLAVGWVEEIRSKGKKGCVVVNDSASRTSTKNRFRQSERVGLHPHSALVVASRKESDTYIPITATVPQTIRPLDSSGTQNAFTPQARLIDNLDARSGQIRSGQIHIASLTLSCYLT